jgi:hypothetical protein
MKFTMSLGKKDLLEKIKEEEDLVQLLQEHGPLKTKTIEDLRLTLMTVDSIVICIVEMLLLVLSIPDSTRIFMCVG